MCCVRLKYISRILRHSANDNESEDAHETNLFLVILVELCGVGNTWLKMGVKSFLKINKGMILIRVIYAFWNFGK